MHHEHVHHEHVHREAVHRGCCVGGCTDLGYTPYRFARTPLMTDRLTQLQVCLDQLVAQFNSTINYANMQSDLAPLDDNPTSVFNLAASAASGSAKNTETSGTTSAPNGVAEQQPSADFEGVLNELSTDIILKSRQISMIIDSLPGIGTLPETQLAKISSLIQELDQIEKKRLEKIKEKDDVLRWCEELIVQVSSGISSGR